MKTLEEIRRLLRDRRISVVSKATGVHPNTIRDVRDNPQANPTYRVLEALSRYFEPQEG